MTDPTYREDGPAEPGPGDRDPEAEARIRGLVRDEVMRLRIRLTAEEWLTDHGYELPKTVVCLGECDHEYR